jgi:hypothetical protein
MAEFWAVLEYNHTTLHEQSGELLANLGLLGDANRILTLAEDLISKQETPLTTTKQ